MSDAFLHRLDTLNPSIGGLVQQKRSILAGATTQLAAVTARLQNGATMMAPPNDSMEVARGAFDMSRRGESLASRCMQEAAARPMRVAVLCEERDARTGIVNAEAFEVGTPLHHLNIVRLGWHLVRTEQAEVAGRTAIQHEFELFLERARVNLQVLQLDTRHEAARQVLLREAVAAKQRAEQEEADHLVAVRLQVADWMQVAAQKVPVGSHGASACGSQHYTTAHAAMSHYPQVQPTVAACSAPPPPPPPGPPPPSVRHATPASVGAPTTSSYYDPYAAAPPPPMNPSASEAVLAAPASADLSRCHLGNEGLRRLGTAPLNPETLQVACVRENGISSLRTLPPLPRLHTLDVSANDLRETDDVVYTVKSKCPMLRNFTLCPNPCAPANMPSNLVPRYRAYILSVLPGLHTIDTVPVTPAERNAAEQLFGGAKQQQHHSHPSSATPSSTHAHPNAAYPAASSAAAVPSPSAVHSHGYATAAPSSTTGISNQKSKPVAPPPTQKKKSFFSF